jgi:uncharacterized protein YfeS
MANAPEQGTWCIFGIHSPRARGGGAPGFVGELMTEDGWPHTGLARFEMIFVQRGSYTPYHCSDGTIITDGSKGQSAWFEDYLTSLPTRRFERKKAVLRVVLRGDPALDFSDQWHLRGITVPEIKIATEMVRQGLAFVQSGLKKADGIDISPLIAAADRLAERNWTSDEDLQAALSRAHTADRSRIDAMDPWSKIDLRGAHPKAREILDQPGDWSQLNGFSPHGSDLGADILMEWPKLRGKSVEAVAQRFDLSLTDSTAEAAMDRIQLMLALAFGHVKKSGSCPPDLATKALETLLADKDMATTHVLPGREDEWNRHIERYRKTLASFRSC